MLGIVAQRMHGFLVDRTHGLLTTDMGHLYTAGDAKVSSAAHTPDKPEAVAAKTPEPSLYTETICKIKNGTTLPPNVASSASASPRDKVQYKNSGHRLANPFEG